MVGKTSLMLFGNVSGYGAFYFCVFNADKVRNVTGKKEGGRGVCAKIITPAWGLANDST